MRADIAVKRAATNAIWYNGAAIIVTENIGMIGQTTDSAVVKTEAARETSAERMRRCRARRRAGYRCVMIEISNDEIGGLVRSRLLSADDSEDLDAIQTAVYNFFEQTIGRPR